MIHGMRSTPHAVARAWPRVPTSSLMLYVFLPELLNKYRSESVLMLQATSRALACCRSLQLPSAWLRPAAPMHSPRYIPVGAVPSYMHTGPLSRRTVVFSAGRMCSSHPYAALTPPLRRGSALPLRMLLPATSSSPQHPLRRGSVLLLGVEDHLKIKVTQAFTSRPSPRTPFGPYRATPQV